MLWSIVLALSALGGAEQVSASGQAAEVLVLHTTRRDGELAITGDREIPRVLAAGLDRPLDYYPEYLDTTRFQDPEYQDAFRKFLRLKYQHHRFDLVVCLGCTSLDFADRVRRELSPDAPIVFDAFDAERGRTFRRMANSTGVYSPMNLAPTLRLAMALQPDITQVFVVTGASALDKFYENAAREQFRPFDALTFTYLAGLPMGELEQRLARLPARSIVFYMALFRDGAGTNFASIPVVGRVTASARVPVYSWQAATLAYGVVGGGLVHPEVALDALANQALRLLRGEQADSIPTETPDLYVNEVDWRALRRWHISETRVPPGTRIDSREPDAWERYHNQIIGIAALVMAQTMLIAFLVLERRRRRSLERQAIETRARLLIKRGLLRDLGSRLIHAQDDERSRIARDLHDDVSQRAASLSMHLDLISLRGPLPEGLSRPLQDAIRDAHEIVDSLRNLSHRLHPETLSVMGLVHALDGLRQELSSPATTIDFSHDAVPAAIPAPLTLCFYRIAQEAVSNAIRHGAARHVSLHLGATADRLTLTIADDGVGFDTNIALGKGLGLVSMAERLESVGGTLRIDSQVGNGSHLEISAPLSQILAQPITV